VSERASRVAIALLALAGAGIAGYLTWTHYQPQALVCLSGGGCETVQQSKYAEVAGIPVAVLGLAAYVTLLASAFVRNVWAAVAAAAASLAGLAFAAWLVYVQGAILHAWCVWCLSSDVVLALLTAACLARVLAATSALPNS
jgi:uncharacterized membrane protein